MADALEPPDPVASPPRWALGERGAMRPTGPAMPSADRAAQGDDRAPFSWASLRLLSEDLETGEMPSDQWSIWAPICQVSCSFRHTSEPGEQVGVVVSPGGAGVAGQDARSRPASRHSGGWRHELREAGGSGLHRRPPCRGGPTLRVTWSKRRDRKYGGGR